MPSCKLYFCVRNDFHFKFGGDTLQIQKYIEHNSSSIASSIITLDDFKKNRAGYIAKKNIFVIVNIDRCFEAIEFYRELTALRQKYVALPIHHSNEKVDKFNRMRFGLTWNFIQIFGGLYFIEKLKAVVWSMLTKKNILLSLRHLLFIKYKNAIKKLLSESEAWACIAHGELDDLVNDFDVSPPKVVGIIKNGYDTAEIKDSGSSLRERDIDILVAGRIEERKNQLAIALVLNKTSFKVIFIGAINENNSSYGRKFMEVIERSNNLTYLGSINSNDTHEYYSRSKIHLSASWFEVSSLVDIEASMNGCFVISSLNGHSDELLDPASSYYLSPESVETLPGAIENILSNINEQPIVKPAAVPSWKQSSRSFFSLIEKCDNHEPV